MSQYCGINYFKGKVSRLRACASWNVSPSDSTTNEEIGRERMRFTETVLQKNEKSPLYLWCIDI